MLVNIVTPRSAGRFFLPHGFSSGPHHGDTAQGVYVDHPHPRELRRCGDCSCYGIGYVVKLEIEEDLEAQTREPFNRPRAFRREELEPNLEEACRTAKPPRQGAGRP